MKSNLQQQVEELIASGDYLAACEGCIKLIELEPQVRDHYWNLGFIQLLQDLEEEAQITWMQVLGQGEAEEIECWTSELADFLKKRAKQQEDIEQYQSAWLIRQYNRELQPENLANLFAIVKLSQKLNSYKSDDLDSLGIIHILQTCQNLDIKEDIFIQIIDEILTYTLPDDRTLEFLSLCIPHLSNNSSTIQKLTNSSITVCVKYSPHIAVKIAEILLELDSENLRVLICLYEFYKSTLCFDQALETAARLFNLSINLADKIFASSILIQALAVNCQNFNKVVQLCDEVRLMQKLLMNSSADTLSLDQALSLLIVGSYFPYVGDRPKEDQTLRQNLHDLAQTRINTEFKEVIRGYHLQHTVKQKLPLKNRPLKIGYLSSCLRRHSIGWLTRSLFEYHDRSKFKLYGYFVSYNSADPLQEWFANKVHKAYKSINNSNAKQIAQAISQDGIDILIDLDSITSAICSQVLAFKPAPIQVTWLGWDAAGHSQVDYFIADPFVLPENAQEYYLEKIWRLSQTFIAVDGFEVAAPTLHREQMNIPDDAIIYFSAQQSFKRNPATAKLQLQILKLVPNSYLLIKGSGEQNSTKQFFDDLAASVGVDSNRLRFLPLTEREEEHRANLKIADIVLDTYPYNGATHTMETLWMEVPLVTLVGQQFSARNSYTMMINAGISEGIAWTEAEYVEWGVRLGKDANLRKEVCWKLRQGKQTAPLWKAKQFTKEIESAYEQMWNKFQVLAIKDLSIADNNDHKIVIESEAQNYNTDGIACAQQGNLEKAISNFQAALAIQSDYADAYYNLGIALSEKGDQENAIANFKQAIACNSQYAYAYYNLGLTLAKQEKYLEAFAAYEKALEIAPEDIDTLIGMGNLHLEQRQPEEAYSYYKVALDVDPTSSEAHCSIGIVLNTQGKLLAAIPYFETALKLDPNYASAHYNLGNTYFKLGKESEAIVSFQKALELKPDFDDAYWNIVNTLSHPKDHNNKTYKFLDECTKQYFTNCREKSPIKTLLSFLSNCLIQGTNGELALFRLEELETFLYQNSESLTNTDVMALYPNLQFMLPNIRDDIAANSKTSKLVAQLCKNKRIFVEHKKNQSLHITTINKTEFSSLKIGFISPHFCRHSMGWCSLDFIRELSKINPNINLYLTGNPKPDDLTSQFESIAMKFYRQKSSSENDSFVLDEVLLVEEIQKDNIDILVDIDSITHPCHASILAAKPAPYSLVWLGYDAPQMDSSNYFLVDQYTHPKGVDQYYVEQLVRMPNSLVAISGLVSEEVDRDSIRDSLGIREDQVAYLCIAPARKFTPAMVSAQIQILKNVPNSILLQRGFGYGETMQEVYKREFAEQEIDISRYIFLPPEYPEEKHRSIYAIADVLLDSYPFNGGTLSLETLWFNLPMVTRTGEQLFSRMGYSFLSSLGIKAGIAKTWEEYVYWGIQFGLDRALRESVISQLIQSKKPETLSPLWNPKKFAKDFYSILEKIVLSEE